MSRSLSALPAGARDLPEVLHPVVIRQQGLLSTAQLRAAAVTREQVRWGLKRRWSAPLPGVILLTGGALPAEQRPLAAVLHGGPRSALAGPSAAAAHGVTAAATSGDVHLLVPPTCAARRRDWVTVHRSEVLDTPRTVRGVMTCSAERAVIDATRWSLTLEKAQAIAIEACQRRITTPERLRAELERLGHARGTGQARLAVDAADTGAWSIPEFHLARVVAGSTVLPTPWLNPVLTTIDGTRLTSPDLWFDDVALAVMVHSKAHHSLGDDWSRTVESDAELTAAGAVVLGITPATIRDAPAAALRLIERAHASAGPRTTRIIAKPRR